MTTRDFQKRQKKKNVEGCCQITVVAFQENTIITQYTFSRRNKYIL